jgi:hypothetical protein
MGMNANKFVAGGLAVTFTAPFIGPVLAHPTAPPPEAPNRVVLYALQQLAVGSSITAANITLDTMLGREISVAPRVDQHPRPAFIAPSPWIVI